MTKYYTLNQDKTVQYLGEGAEDYAKWAATLGHHEIVRVTKVDLGRVSTIFLGLDLSFCPDDNRPLLFETMIFSDSSSLDGYQVKCSTWDEALKDHGNAVRLLSDEFIQHELAVRKKFNGYQ